MKTDNPLQQKYLLVKEMLSGIPGITGVGMGEKETGGQLTGEMSWRIYVQEKKALHLVLMADQIPAVLFDIPTDVIAHTPVMLNCGDNGYQATLTPGIQIANDARKEGTLGCFARLKAGGGTVILSNHHVLYAAKRGDHATIGQPYITCSSCSSCGAIANNIGDGSNGRGANPQTQVINGENYTIGNMDGGIAALISNVRPFTNAIPGIGMITGTPPAGQLGVVINVSGDLQHPDPDSLVRKLGITTGLTLGQVVKLAEHNPIYDDPKEVSTRRGLIDQILIMPRQSPGTVGTGIDFCDFGDSGSVVVNRHNQVIGLLSGLIKLDSTQLAAMGMPPGLGNFAAVTPIQRVLDQLGIEIPGSFQSTGTTAGAVMTQPAALYSLISPSQTFKKLQRQLSTSPLGEAVATAIEKHTPEIGELVNHCRPVTVVWHRHYGPAWSVHFLNSIKDRDYRIPDEVKDVSKQLFLSRMAVVLEENGSKALQQDIVKYTWLINAMATTSTVTGLFQFFVTA